MAVCNLFNKLTNTSGNFLMFSQYVEDITRNFSDGDNYKVVPSKFIALNIDYSNINKNTVLANKDNFNVGIPMYFQNYFENACAYGRLHYSDWVNTTGHSVATTWNPLISRNLFWNSMIDGKFVNAVEYGNTKKLKEVVYFGDISMHSYNEHQGMGYGEIYCYIPSDTKRMNCQVKEHFTDVLPRQFDDSNKKPTLEGYTDKFIGDYSKKYYYNNDFSMSFDDSDVAVLANSSDSYYNINTIVVLYSVLEKINDDWKTLYSDIPMGIYFTGIFDENNKMTNTVTKYVSTSYGVGTSYGLRLCTRFSVAPNNSFLKESDVIVDNSGYNNLCQLMTAMNENLSKMLDVSKSAINTTQQYKDLLSIFKNNKTNVPYVKDINGVDYWFVNGRAVSAVNNEENSCCAEVSSETIRKRIANLQDAETYNDWSYIDDPNGCDCFPLNNRELAEKLGLDPTKYHEYGGGTTGDGPASGPGSGNGNCGCPDDVLTEDDIATVNDVAAELFPEK